MTLPQVKTKTQIDFVAVLERKMARVRALHKELNRILDAEYTAGMAHDPKSLKKLVLRKRNCVSRFEHLVRSMGEQLDMMGGSAMLSTMPRTLVNRVEMIPGLTPRQEDVLLPLAMDLEQRHLDLMKAARRNGVLFKAALGRLSVASKYVNQGNIITP